MKSLQDGSAIHTHLTARWTALAALTVVAAATAWYVTSGRDSKSTTSGNTVTTLAVSPAQLARTGQALNRPIYWIGNTGKPTTYELTQNSNGEVFVRYLPVGVVAGSPTAHLAIGTYPMTNAYAVTKSIGAKAGSVKVAAPGKAVAFYVKTHPENVYLAFPGASNQIEIFDPSPAEARKIVSSGVITNASAKAASGQQSVTGVQLAGYSEALGHPIYWLGPKPGMTYEFSRTLDGRTYVRYLPKGVALGTRKAYLTVGTYPMDNAFAVTKKLATSSQILKMTANSVEFSLKRRPTSAYVAYRGSAYQVEVYNPAATTSRGVVAAGPVTRAT